MNSKEALEILFASYNYNGNYQEVIEAREKLEQDLERLEKLEQENESLKLTIKCQNASEEQTKLYALGLEKENQELKEYFDKIASGNTIIELFRENHNFKKAIEIFRKYKKTPITLWYHSLGKDIDTYEEFVDSYVCSRYREIPNREEFELLKEVLCDGEQNS